MSQEKLFLAAKEDDLTLAQSVLADVVIDGRNEDGESALHIAAKFGSEKVAALLLSKEVYADIDVLDNLLHTPLHLAVISQKLGMVELLNRHNPRKDVMNKDENTALMLAKNLPNEAIIRELIRGGSPNPHAERLVLRAKIKSFIEGEDVISKLSAELPDLIKKIDNSDVQKRLKNLRAQLDQPEKLLQYDFLKELLKSEKKEKQDKKDKSDKDDKSERLNKADPFEQNKSPFEKLPEELQNAFVDMDLAIKLKSEKSDKLEEKIIQKRNGELFKKLNAVVAEIQALKILSDSKKQPLLSREIIASLETLEKIYINYREELCQAKGLLRLQMCQNRICISGGFLGNNCYYLNPSAAQLFETLYINEFLVENVPSAFIANVKARNHVILQIGDTYIKKASESDKNDGTEGIESTVHSCNSVMAGQGTAASESLRIERNGVQVEVSASKGIKGETGQDIFNQSPEAIEYLDTFNHSAQSVLAMLLLVDDQKPDNFIGIIIREFIKIILKLISIDNDRAFRDPIQVQHFKNGEASKHFIELKSLFFSCPHMDRPIDLNFRNGFIKQPPIIFILSWLRDLLHKKEPEKLNFDLIQGVYHRIVQIHAALKEHPKITVHELLAIVHPLIAPYYEHIRRNKPDILDAMNAPYSIKRPPLEQFYANNPEALKKLAAYNKTDNDLRVAQKDLLEESCSLFVNQLDFATFGDIYIQGYVLDIIAADLQFIKQLRICNADALNDERLGTLALRLPKLESITLVNCSRYNGSGLSALLLNKPSIHITLEEFSQISTVNLHHLIRHAENLTLVVGGRSYSVKKQGKMQEEVAELLKVALHNEAVHLTTALLMCGVQFTTDPNALAHLHLQSSKDNKANKVKSTLYPLHLACSRGNFALVLELLRFGLPVDSNNADRCSALDVTVDMLEKSQNKADEARYLKILLYLLEKGALQSKNPVDIMTRICKSILSPDQIKNLTPVLRQALFIFACVNNVLTPGLIPLLLPKNLETLVLNTPKELNLATLTLSPQIMTAIREHLPNLKHLNITRCGGVTLEVMQVIWTMPKVTTIDMDFKQILDCHLLKSNEIDQAANFERMNKKINVISLNLKDCLPPPGTAKPNQELLKKVGKFLAESKTVLYLDMYKCKLEAEDLGGGKNTEDENSSEDAKDFDKEGLAAGLRANTSLLIINVNNNSLSDAGVEKFIAALLAHPALRSLSIDSNKFSVKGAKAIGKLLHKSDTLEVLSISDNPITGVGALALAEAIKTRRQASRKRNTSFRLKSLYVNRNELNETGALALISALMFHPLEFADFSYNTNIGNNGAKALMQLLQSSEALHYLRADNLGTSSEGIRNDLDELIKRNALLYRDAAMSEQIASAHELEQQHVPDLMPPEYLALKAAQEQIAALRAQRSSPAGLSLSTIVRPGTVPRSPMTEYRLPPSLPVGAVSSTEKKDIKQKIKDKMRLLNKADYIFVSTIENDHVTIVIKQVPEHKLPLDVNSFWKCLLKLLCATREIEYSQNNKRLELTRLEKDELDLLKSILVELNIAPSETQDSNSRLLATVKPVSAWSASTSSAGVAVSTRPSLIGDRRPTIVSTVTIPYEQQRASALGSSQSVPLEPSHIAIPKKP